MKNFDINLASLEKYNMTENNTEEFKKESKFQPITD